MSMLNVVKVISAAATGICTLLSAMPMATLAAAPTAPAVVSAAPSDTSMVRHGKYSTSLLELREYFQGKDLQFEEMLNDERFEIYETIGDRFRNSAEKKLDGIDSYKKVLRFDDKSRLIVEFMEEHANQLIHAEETYGISRYVIAAIIGIESNFGTITGSYNPFNTYVSMYAVDYRGTFARAQLEELLIFIKNRNLDVFELKSSYAGAMSSAQFIPYSLNKWFVGDDISDMNNSILSVGNYLSYFKDRTGSVEKAVYRYNPSSLYADTVMELAREAEKAADAS